MAEARQIRKIKDIAASETGIPRVVSRINIRQYLTTRRFSSVRVKQSDAQLSPEADATLCASFTSWN
jgi:hypothetical protein